jgi:hypothetical protein
VAFSGLDAATINRASGTALLLGCVWSCFLALRRAHLT